MRSSRTAKTIAVCSAAISFCVTVVPPGRAAEPSAQSSQSWLQHPTEAVGGAIKVVGSAVGSLWSGVTSLFVSEPYAALPAQSSEDDRQFFAALEALGLQLSEISVANGAFSHQTYRFVAARDPSNIDVQRSEQKLADYQAGWSGLQARAKQRIVRAALDMAGDHNFVLTAVDVSLWPWPMASYEVTARNRPPEAGERRVIEATQPQ